MDTHYFASPGQGYGKSDFTSDKPSLLREVGKDGPYIRVLPC